MRVSPEIIDTLSRIERLLRDSGHDGQADYIASVIDLGHRSQALFGDALTTVDMWGGSGAVWEVGEFRSADDARQFQSLIVRLVEQMAELGIQFDPAVEIAWVLRFWLDPNSPDSASPPWVTPPIPTPKKKEVYALGDNYILRRLREKHGGS